VIRNKPYAGGFITEHYGEPALGRHALQIEINRALYMDERNMQKKPVFAAMADDLTQAFAQVIADIEGELVTRPIAAE
jgi:N-formylglutamate amidohydrolase